MTSPATRVRLSSISVRLRFRQHFRLAVGTLLITVLIFGGITGYRRTRSLATPSEYLAVGMPAPSLLLPAARGGAVHVPARAGRVMLISFLQTQPDTAAGLSRSQEVFLASMARQYGPKGVQIALVDATSMVTGQHPSMEDLVRTTYDWDLGAIPLLRDDAASSAARRYGVRQVPTTVLVGPQGRVAQIWTGLVLPANLALALQQEVGAPVLPHLPVWPHRPRHIVPTHVRRALR